MRRKRRKRRQRAPVDRTPTILEEAAAQLKRSIVEEAIRAEDGNRARAGKRLGYKHPGDFLRMLKTLDLRLPKARMGRPKVVRP